MLTVNATAKMPPPQKDALKEYNFENCFGFDENDCDFELWNNSCALNNTSASLEFQPNKPYRLALYIRPAQRRRFGKTNASTLVNTLIGKQIKTQRNANRVSFKVATENEAPKKTKPKGNDTMLFVENAKSENESKISKKTHKKVMIDKDLTSRETPARTSILKEINTRPVSKSKQDKIRRSYERKCKEKDTENTKEPPSEEIIKELEIKKLSRTKSKKMVKEDQELEIWAKHINSDFNDVDKFELSITYD